MARPSVQPVAVAFHTQEPARVVRPEGSKRRARGRRAGARTPEGEAERPAQQSVGADRREEHAEAPDSAPHRWGRSRLHRRRSQIEFDRARWGARLRSSSYPERSRDRVGSARSSGALGPPARRQAKREAHTEPRRALAEPGAERTAPAEDTPAARRGRARIVARRLGSERPRRPCRTRCRSGRPAGALRRIWSRRPSRHHISYPRRAGHSPQSAPSRQTAPLALRAPNRGACAPPPLRCEGARRPPLIQRGTIPLSAHLKHTCHLPIDTGVECQIDRWRRIPLSRE